MKEMDSPIASYCVYVKTNYMAVFGVFLQQSLRQPEHLFYTVICVITWVVTVRQTLINM